MKQNKKKKNWFEPIANFYEKGLKFLLKFRYLVILFFVGIFALTILLSLDTIKAKFPLGQ